MNTTNLIEDLRLLSPPEYGAWLALVLAATVVLALGLVARARRRPPAPSAPPNSGPALWDVALAELERLTPLLRQDHSREYAIRSTTVLRHYIEARYALRAPNLATEEFLQAARQSPALPAAHRKSLARFLEWCDLFKFGRYLAPGSELEPLHAAAVAFVLASRPPAPSHPPLEEPA